MKSLFQLSKTTVIFHWLIAIAMICSVIFGLYLEGLPDEPDKVPLISIHKSVGMLILFAASLRILWRMLEGFFPPLSASPVWQERAAKALYIFLLAATIFMPVSGIMMSLGSGYSVGIFGLELITAGDKNEILAETGEIIHGLGKTLLIIAVLIHVAATIKHSLINKDSTFKRMLGFKVD